jgi:hypothetical protein
MTELVKFGWTDYFARHFIEDNEFTPARVIAEHRLIDNFFGCPVAG